MRTDSLKLFLITATLTASACDVDDETQIGDAAVAGEPAGDDAPEFAEDDAPGLAEDAPEALADADDPASLAGYCDSVTTWDTAWSSFENQVITLINQKRASGASCGGVWRKAVPAVAKHNKLRCAARRHSKDMGVNDFTSHTGSKGASPWDRIKAAGYAYSAASENIAWGWNTPQKVVDAWMKSAGHCDNIMSAKVTQVGVGYYYKNDSTWKHYWTQDFGKPL